MPAMRGKGGKKQRYCSLQCYWETSTGRVNECVHCHQKRLIRGRGLCNPCYENKDIRCRYQSKHDNAPVKAVIAASRTLRDEALTIAMRTRRGEQRQRTIELIKETFKITVELARKNNP